MLAERCLDRLPLLVRHASLLKLRVVGVIDGERVGFTSYEPCTGQRTG